MTTKINAYNGGGVTNLPQTVTNIQTELNSLKTNIDTNMSDNGLYITTYISGTSGYREYFSDEAKTTRVLLEQWGLVTSSTTEAPIAVTFLKSYSDTNYNIQISSRNGDFPATYYTNVSSVSGYTASTTGFYGTTSKSSSSSATFYWHTIGV